MRISKTILVSLLILSGFLSCGDDKNGVKANEDPAVTTLYFIRHAEKDRSNPDNVDPELNQDGLGRAIRWAEVFDFVPLDAIYTTDFERTEMTAAPTAVKKDIVLEYYNLDDLNIVQFLESNLGKHVLIVGHSNSTPKFVNAVLGLEKYTTMDDYDNSSLFIVRIIDGKATDIRLKMD